MIAGTALGLGLFNGNNGGGLFGGNGTSNGCSLTCEDKIELTAAIYEGALRSERERFADRQTINMEMFGLYKSQIDADFNLYKGQRDSFDVLQKEISDLRCHVAVTDAVRPYQDKLIQNEIAFSNERMKSYVDSLDCWNIKGVKVLPSTPTITGYPSYNCCGCMPTPQGA